jgi:UDP-N-acetylglucosamine--N-acetylmuramyl-(pentapeptide) pyrophosphoryl-undecaprenol N-acetylglucosamine transferase
VTDLFRTFWGVVQSIYYVGRERPAVIFAKGGFVSFPIALAGWLWRVPVVAHESDLTPGLANKLVLPFIQTLCVSFAATAEELERNQRHRKLKVVHTGTPIRAAMLEGQASAGRAQLGLGESDPLLVVTGGSLGADALNAVVRDALEDLAREFTVLHVCGPGKLGPRTHPRYRQVEYVDEGWGDILAAADVVVSRAGANALFELLALRKLALLVPLSAQASRGDQIQNAGFAAAQGLCEVLQESELTPQSLVAAIHTLQANRARLQAALARFEVPPATDLIVAEIIAAA